MSLQAIVRILSDETTTQIAGLGMKKKTRKPETLFPHTSAEHMAVPRERQRVIGVSLKVAQSLCIPGTDYCSWGAKD